MTDRRVVFAVVLFLGAFALLGLGATTWLIDHQRDASNIAVVSGMTGTALGALGGILASTRSGPDSMPVMVTNPPGDPVPVDPAPAG
ncbi:MAG: hypothetical protein SHS37scaffold145_16 [Phage 71_18]|nr:MAG: hypothetical protein SHS37scaffold145_16 [Phage 71_18]